MSLFGSIRPDKRQKRTKSDPGPVGHMPTTLLPSRRFDEVGAAPNVLEPDVLEVKDLYMCRDHPSRELPKMSRRRRKISKKFLELLSSPFGLFLLLLVYMVLGAFMFIAIESGRAKSLHTDLITLRLEYARTLNQSCYQDAECVAEYLRGWQLMLWRFPLGIIDESLKLWSFENAFQLCFSVVSTIGYGNITPYTRLGRILVIIYATFGIPIMLLFVSDIGTVTARWLKNIVVMYRSKRRSAVEAKRNMRKQQTNSDHKTMTTKANTKENGGNVDEEIGMRIMIKPKSDSKQSSNESIGFDDISRNGTDKYDRANESPSDIHEGSKGSILNDVAKQYKVPEYHPAEQSIPCIIVDSDSCDQSDIEEVLGEIIEDDMDIYDSADLSVHAAWDENESEDDVGVDDGGEARRRYQENILQEGDLHPVTIAEVIVKDDLRPHRLRSLSVKETTPKEAHPRLEKPHVTDVEQEIDGSIQNGYVISKNTSRASKDDKSEINHLRRTGVTQYRNMTESAETANDPKKSKDPKDNCKQKHLTSSTIQETPINVNVINSSSDNSNIPKERVKFQGMSSSRGNIEKELKDFSFPWWMAFLLLFVYLLIGMVMFHYALGWTYLNSFYYSFVSLSTIGFGDLYYQPSQVRGSIYYTFIYCFVGFCYTSMCMSLSSRELLRIARRVAHKIGYYRSRRLKRDFRAFWKARRLKAPKRRGRWTLRRRKTLRVSRFLSETSGVYP